MKIRKHDYRMYKKFHPHDVPNTTVGADGSMRDPMGMKQTAPTAALGPVRG
jgi:Cu/Zn superoxide dismutase